MYRYYEINTPEKLNTLFCFKREGSSKHWNYFNDLI